MAENDRINRRSSLSRDAILDAAEALFGRYGPEGVSLRQISARAGSANNSAVQYHFGNKEGLIDGIFTRRLESLELRRDALLHGLVERGETADTRSLLEALLLPIAEEKDSAGQCSFAAFLVGLRLFGDISRWLSYSEDAPVTVRVNTLLRESLRELADETFRLRRISAVSLFLIAVVDWDRQSASSPPKRSGAREQYLHQVLDFAAAGMVRE